MGKYNIFYLFENPRRGMQASNFTTNVPKILDLKSLSEQIFPRKLSLGAPELYTCSSVATCTSREVFFFRQGNKMLPKVVN